MSMTRVNRYNHKNCDPTVTYPIGFWWERRVWSSHKVPLIMYIKYTEIMEVHSTVQEIKILFTKIILKLEKFNIQDPQSQITHLMIRKKICSIK